MTSVAPSRPGLRRPSSRTWVDVAVLTILAALGLLGFAVSFSSGLYLVAGFGGLVVGTVAGVLASMLRLGPLVTALLAAAAYFLFGSALTMPAFATFGVLPSGATLSGLATGAVFGWSDIVTLTTPVVAPDYIAVLPYVATWVVGLISSTFATRWFASRRRAPLSSLLALLAPIALYVASVLTGTSQPYLAAVRGVTFAVIALVWFAWRVPDSTNVSLSESSGLLRRKLMGVGVVALVAVVGGSLLGAASAPDTAQRFVLREKIQPPFDPLVYPSPLSGFRSYAKSTSTATLFTVDGLTKDDRIRIATMDSYDGQVWNVTSPTAQSQASGTFGLVGARLDPTSLLTVAGHETLTVDVGTYHDVWMPTSGYATSVDFTAKKPDSTRVRYNGQTGILVDTGTLTSGQRYTLEVDRAKIPTDAQLEKVGVANISLPPVQNVPELIGSKATEFAGKASTPIDKLRAIEAAFKKQGTLSHGTDGEPPSRAGHGADRMKLLLSQTPMVGDQEQYASAFALMARSLGYPARVVMGFVPKTITAGQPVAVRNKDVTAWVEVAFQGVGWVPFDPTPDASNVPTVQRSKPQNEALPQVRQPPRNSSNQDNLVSPTEISRSKKTPDAFALPGWVVPTAFGVGIPLALYFLPLLIIAALKRRRRKRRLTTGDPDRRAAGAWDEMVDLYAELGYSVSRTATRVQSALSFEEQFREQLETREKERADAARGRSNRSARASAKAEAKSTTAVGSRANAASALLGGPMARLKDASTWRPGVAGENDALPVLPGLREFAVASNAAVFSGGEVGDEMVEKLWVNLDDANDAARHSVSWFRRRLSSFRLRSRARLSGLRTRLTSASSHFTRKAVTQ
jgi:MFS family permease